MAALSVVNSSLSIFGSEVPLVRVAADQAEPQVDKTGDDEGSDASRGFRFARSGLAPSGFAVAGQGLPIDENGKFITTLNPWIAHAVELPSVGDAILKLAALDSSALDTVRQKVLYPALDLYTSPDQISYLDENDPQRLIFAFAHSDRDARLGVLRKLAPTLGAQFQILAQHGDILVQGKEKLGDDSVRRLDAVAKSYGLQGIHTPQASVAEKNTARAFVKGTDIVPGSTHGLVYTVDMVPFISALLPQLSPGVRNAVEEYAHVLAVLVGKEKSEVDFKLLGFPSEESYLFAIAETLARIDALTACREAVLREKTKAHYHVTNYKKAETILKAHGKEKMPDVVLRVWSGEVNAIVTAPGQASDYVSSLKWAMSFPKGKEYVEGEMREILQSAGISLDDVLNEKMSSEQLSRSAVSQPLILGTQLAILEVMKSFWMIPEIISAATGLSQGLLVGAVSAGVIDRREALEIVANNGQAMESAEPYVRGATPMLSVQGVDPLELLRLSLHVTLHLNFLKGFAHDNELIVLLKEKEILTDEELARLTKPLSGEEQGELNRICAANKLHGELLPVEILSQDQTLRERFVFLKLVHALRLENLFGQAEVLTVIQNAGLADTTNPTWLHSQERSLLERYGWLYLDKTFDMIFPRLDGQVDATRTKITGVVPSQVLSGTYDASALTLKIIKGQITQQKNSYGDRVPQGVKIGAIALPVTQPFHGASMLSGMLSAVERALAKGSTGSMGHAPLYLNSVAARLDQLEFYDRENNEWRRVSQKELATMIVADFINKEQNLNGVFFSGTISKAIDESDPNVPVAVFDVGPKSVHARGNLLGIVGGRAKIICLGQDKYDATTDIYGWNDFVAIGRTVHFHDGSPHDDRQEPVENQTGDGALPRFTNPETGEGQYTGSVGYLSGLRLPRDAQEIIRRIGELLEVSANGDVKLHVHDLLQRWGLSSIVGLAGMTGPGGPSLVGAVAREGGTAALAAGNFPPFQSPFEPEPWQANLRGIIEAQLETTRRFTADGKLDGGRLVVYVGSEQKRYILSVFASDGKERSEFYQIVDTDGNMEFFPIRDFSDAHNPGKNPTERWARLVQQIVRVDEVDPENPRMKTFGVNVMHAQDNFCIPMLEAAAKACDLGVRIGFVTSGLFLRNPSGGDAKKEMRESMALYLPLLARGVSLVPLLPTESSIRDYEENLLPHIEGLLRQYFSSTDAFPKMLTELSLFNSRNGSSSDLMDRQADEERARRLASENGLVGFYLRLHQEFVSARSDLFGDDGKKFFAENPLDLLTPCAPEGADGGGHNAVYSGTPGRVHIGSIDKDGGKTYKIVTGGMTRPVDVADALLAGKGPKGKDVVSAQVGTALGMTESSSWAESVLRVLYRAASRDPQHRHVVIANLISEFDKPINLAVNIENLEKGEVASFGAALVLLVGEPTLGYKGILNEDQVNAEKVWDIFASEPADMLRFRYSQWQNKLETSYAFFDARFGGRLELMEQIWQSLLAFAEARENPSNQSLQNKSTNLRKEAIQEMSLFMNPVKMGSETDEQFSRRRREARRLIRGYFAEFRTQNAQIPGINADWVYVLAGMSIQNLPQGWIERYFQTEQQDTDGRISQFGQKITVREMLDHMNKGVVNYLTQLYGRAVESQRRSVSSVDYRPLTTVAGLSVNGPVIDEQGNKVIRFRVTARDMEEKDFIEAIRHQGTGDLSWLLRTEEVLGGRNRESRERFLKNPILNFLKPRYGRTFEVILKDRGVGQSSHLVGIRIFDEFSASTGEPFKFAEVKIDGESVHLEVFNPTHHLDPALGEPTVIHYDFSLRTLGKNLPPIWNLDEARMQRDSQLMLAKALLHRDPVDYDGLPLDHVYSAQVTIGADTLGFNKLVAVGARHLLDTRGVSPVCAHLFALVAEGLAGGIEAQGHPDAGQANAALLLHEGIQVTISPELDLTVYDRRKVTPDRTFTASSQLSSVAYGPLTAASPTQGLRKITSTAVTDDQGRRVLEIENRTVTLDAGAERKKHTREASRELTTPRVTRVFSPQNQVVVWEPKHDIAVTRTDIRGYGRVDANVFHHWDILAEAAGQEHGIIAQGMLTAAQMLSLVTEEFLPLSDIRSLNVKFTGKALPEGVFRDRLVRKGFATDGHELYELQRVPVSGSDQPIVRIEIIAKAPYVIGAAPGQAFEEPNMFIKGESAFRPTGEISPEDQALYEKGLAAYRHFLDLADAYWKREIGFSLGKIVAANPPLFEFEVKDPLGVWALDRFGKKHFYRQGERATIFGPKEGALFHALVRQPATVAVTLATYLGMKAMGIPDADVWVVSSLGLTSAVGIVGVFGDTPQEMLSTLLVAHDRANVMGVTGGQFGLMNGLCLKDLKPLVEKFNNENSSGSPLVWATSGKTPTMSAWAAVDLASAQAFVEFVKNWAKKAGRESEIKPSVDLKTPFAFHSPYMEEAAEIANTRMRGRLANRQIGVYRPEKMAGKIHLDARDGRLAQMEQDPLQEIVFQISAPIDGSVSIAQAMAGAGKRRIRVHSTFAAKVSMGGDGAFGGWLKSKEGQKIASRVQNWEMGSSDGAKQILGTGAKSIETRAMREAAENSARMKAEQKSREEKEAREAQSSAQQSNKTGGQDQVERGLFRTPEEAQSGMLGATDVGDLLAGVANVFSGRSDVPKNATLAQFGVKDTVTAPEFFGHIAVKFGFERLQEPDVTDLPGLQKFLTTMFAQSPLTLFYAALNPVYSSSLPQGHFAMIKTNPADESLITSGVKHVLKFGPGVLPMVEQILREKKEKLLSVFTGDQKKVAQYFFSVLEKAKSQLEKLVKSPTSSDSSESTVSASLDVVNGAIDRKLREALSRAMGGDLTQTAGAVQINPLAVTEEGKLVPKSHEAARADDQNLQKIRDLGEAAYLKSLTEGQVWVPEKIESWGEIEKNGAESNLFEMAELLRRKIDEGQYDFSHQTWRDAYDQRWVEYQITHLANQMGEKSMGILKKMIGYYFDDEHNLTAHAGLGAVYVPVLNVLIDVYNKAMTEVDGEPLFKTSRLLDNSIDPLSIRPREVKLLHGASDPVEIVPTGETLEEFYQKARENKWMSPQLLDEVEKLIRGEVNNLSHVRALILAGTSTAAKPWIAFLLSKGAQVRMTTTRHLSDVRDEFAEIYRKYAVKGAKLDIAWEFGFNKASVKQLVDAGIDDGFVPNLVANAGGQEDYFTFNAPDAKKEGTEIDAFHATAQVLVKTTLDVLRYTVKRYQELDMGVRVQFVNFHSPAAQMPLPGSGNYPFHKSALSTDALDNMVRVEGLRYSDGQPLFFATHLEIGATLPSRAESGKLMSGKVADAWLMRKAILEDTEAETISFWAEQMAFNLLAMVSLGKRIFDRQISHRQSAVGGFDDERVMGKVGDTSAPFSRIAEKVAQKMSADSKAAREYAQSQFGRPQMTRDQALEYRAFLAEKAGDTSAARADRAASRSLRERELQARLDRGNHPFAYGGLQRLVGDNTFHIRDDHDDYRLSGLIHKSTTFDSGRHRSQPLSDDDLVIVALAGSTSGGKDLVDGMRTILEKRGLSGMMDDGSWKALANIMKGQIKANDGTERIVGQVLDPAQWDSLDEKQKAEQKKLMMSRVGLRHMQKLLSNEREEKMVLSEDTLIPLDSNDKNLLLSMRRENERARALGKSDTYVFLEMPDAEGKMSPVVVVRKGTDVLTQVVGRLRVSVFANFPDNFFENLQGMDKNEYLFGAISTILGRLSVSQLNDMLGMSVPRMHQLIGAYLIQLAAVSGMVDEAGKGVLQEGSSSDTGTSNGNFIQYGIPNAKGAAGTQQIGLGGSKVNRAAACASGLDGICHAVQTFFGLSSAANNGLIPTEEYLNTVMYLISVESAALASTHVAFDDLGQSGAMTRDEFLERHGRRDRNSLTPHDLLRDGFLAGQASSGMVVMRRGLARLLGQAPLAEIVATAQTSDFHSGHDGDQRANTAPGKNGQTLLNWLIHGALERKGYKSHNVYMEASHSTNTGADQKQAKALSLSDQARGVEEQQLAFELCLKAIMELGHTLGATLIEPIQAILLFSQGIVPGHLSLNNITEEQYHRLSTVISRININFSGNIRPMKPDDLLLVYNFGFHAENRAAAFARPESSYGSISEALQTQRKILQNKAQAAANWMARNRTFDRSDILNWDAPGADINRYTVPNYISKNAKVLAEMEVMEEVYRAQPELLNPLFREIHNRERKDGERLFSYRYENLKKEVAAYYQWKQRQEDESQWLVISDEDWQTDADLLQLSENTTQALSQLGVEVEVARQYISDRQKFSGGQVYLYHPSELVDVGADARDLLRDVLEYFLPHRGAMTSLAELNTIAREIGFDFDTLTPDQRIALAVRIALAYAEAMEGERRSPEDMQIRSLLQSVKTAWGLKLQKDESRGMVPSRFGRLTPAIQRVVTGNSGK